MTILYVEYSSNNTRKLLVLINEYKNVAGTKINTQKFIVFLYTDNEKSKRGIKEIIPFIMATKRIKYLGINLRRQKNFIEKTIRN